MCDDKEEIKNELIMTLTTELPVLRARLGVSQEVMASAVGISRQTYSAIETKNKKMSWTVFMALVAVLDLNEATSVMLDHIPNFIQSIRLLIV
ncbi:MAG: helix-turn-helix domain-containing protein [Lachnospiraceae bacterium]|nr:helix-turn-helix domain-containing protein [Lachnospiraceae bacterium]